MLITLSVALLAARSAQQEGPATALEPAILKRIRARRQQLCAASGADPALAA